MAGAGATDVTESADPVAHTANSYDYLVVGSGAGGGPLAANLARAGMRVLLLEAGTDAENDQYRVPCFHGLATEDREYRWDFFVRHYEDDLRQRRDSKFLSDRDGVYYPRAGTLGGCTAHNAMITVHPHDADWDRIAAITGDRSWRSARMRRYFVRLERCEYRRGPWKLPRNRVLASIVQRIPLISRLYLNWARHGYKGWLSTDLADPTLALRDGQLLNVVISAARDSLVIALGRALERAEDLILGSPLAFLDPNDWRGHNSSGEGLWLIPLAVRNGARNSTREHIRDTQRRYPGNLEVRTGCLVTRVLFDRDNRATGVEYLEAEHAYRADPRWSPVTSTAPRRQISVRREVVLSGGAFNTPQLLKLSGVGPAEELRRFGIDVKVDLPGVGENLQDRYEVGVITEMKQDFSLLSNCSFEAPLPGHEPDPCFREWTSTRGGVYSTNGAVLGVIKRSKPERPLPDLFLFGLPAQFRGYFPGYSGQLEHHKRFFTWAVLKAHTQNTAGRVTLRSADPTDVPQIDFHYFEEGSDSAGEDLDSVADGVEFARELMRHAESHTVREVVPGPTVTTREQIKDFVRNEAWGHHASCTCKIGPSADPLAVVDGRFRVHGITGLRVVDASVFPAIPGFFIVTAVYMLSEKATDAILADVPRRQRAIRASRSRAGAALRRLGPRT